MGLAGCGPNGVHEDSSWGQPSDASSLSDLNMELQDWQQEPHSSLAEALRQMQQERPPDHNAGQPKAMWLVPRCRACSQPWL